MLLRQSRRLRGCVLYCNVFCKGVTVSRDAHTTLASLPTQPEVGFFGVFDGHGGKTASVVGAERLPAVICATEEYMSGDKSAACLSDALRAGFVTLDGELRAQLRAQQSARGGVDHSGSTAVTCFITPTHIIFGNCGDSRGILSSNEAVAFGTKDHKPTDPLETARIRSGGGFVEMGRVCGNLAVSRALGDFQYKEFPAQPADTQIVSVVPDCTVIERTPQDNFVLLACDGIWDVMSNEEAREFVSCHLKAGVSVPHICERMLEFCLEKGSKDNMSVIVVALPNAPTAVSGYQVPAEYRVGNGTGAASAGGAGAGGEASDAVVVDDRESALAKVRALLSAQGRGPPVGTHAGSVAPHDDDAAQ